MALLTIRKDEDPILRKKSREIKKINDRIKQLAEDMLETMYEADGVGLAAVQVGKLKRMLVFDEREEEGAFVLINPVILEQEGECKGTEACLSVSDTMGQVIRPARVKVKAQNLEGEWIEIDADEDLSRILCHEIDHLEGVLFTDKMLPEEFEEGDEA